MLLHEIDQRTDDWFALRLGKITATSFATMANGRKDTIEKLCLKTAAEIITGYSCDNGYVNPAMENGIETEDEAVSDYEIEQLAHVRRVGFVELDQYIGASPDGLVGEDGGIEVKCPQPHTHLTYVVSGGKAWRSYKWQIQGALWITQRKWWDFVSYSPIFPGEKRLYIERVKPDKASFEKLQTGADYCRQRIAEIVRDYNGAQNS